MDPFEENEIQSIHQRFHENAFEFFKNAVGKVKRWHGKSNRGLFFYFLLSMLDVVQKSHAWARANASTRSNTSPKSSCWWSFAASSTTSGWCPSEHSTVTTSSGSKWPTRRRAPLSRRASCGLCTGRRPPSTASASPLNDRFTPPLLQFSKTVQIDSQFNSLTSMLCWTRGEWVNLLGWKLSPVVFYH